MNVILVTISILTLITTASLAEETAAPSSEHSDLDHSTKSTGHSKLSLGTESHNDAKILCGTVLETMNSGGYSYVFIQKKSGDKVWLAVPESPVKIGSRMSFKPGVALTNFESKGLKRTFDTIIFSDGPLSSPTSNTTVTDPMKQLIALRNNGSVIVKDQNIRLAKASGPNAITVEEAFKKSAKLDRKKVVVRGKVVKVSAGIMKRNWIHIQDGSGSAAKGTHDLVCASHELVEVGDVVTASGILVKDRDFGSGYHYKAIVENATFKK